MNVLSRMVKLDEPAQLVKMPRLMFSNRQCFTVSPLEPAMNWVPAQMAICVFWKVRPSK